MMKIITVVTCILFACSVAAPASAALSTSPRMRPYAGLGVLLFPQQNSQQEESFSLYEVPGLARIGSLAAGAVPGGRWIFGEPSGPVPLIVTGRKDAWLRVTYDDAGREAWLKPPSYGRYLTWEQFFKSRTAAVLPGVQNKYLQLYSRPGAAAFASLAPRHSFRVIKLDHDWALIIPPDQGALAWLRWRDEDGRLLLGSVAVDPAVLP